jgi:hypothetical protein
VKTAACARRVLAAGEQCVLEQCSCGALHVTIGAITLRLGPGTVGDIAQTLGEGMRQWALAQVGGSARPARGEGLSS